MTMHLDVLDVRPENHVGELYLRRYCAGELGENDRVALEKRLGEEPELRARIKALETERAAFANSISLERFAGGVERAKRSGGTVSRRRISIATLTAGVTGLAMAAGFAIFVLPSLSISHPNQNHIKGALEKVLVRIQPKDGPQREAVENEKLVAGDRLRIGYACGSESAEGTCGGRARYLVAMSIDDAGEMTAIYPEAGQAVAIEPTARPIYLPGGVEFFGRGHERLVVFLSDLPLTVDSARQSLGRAYVAAGSDLASSAFSQLGKSESERPFEVHTYLFEKP